MKVIVHALLLAALISSPAHEHEPGLPAELQLSLLVNVLSFDRELMDRSEIVIAVIFQREFVASLRARDDWLEAAQKPRRVGRATVRVVPIEYRSEEALLHALREHHATVAFLTPMRAVNVTAIAESARAAGVRTASGEAALVQRAAAIGLLLRDDRPRVVINMPLSDREGSRFSSQLLRVAEVIK